MTQLLIPSQNQSSEKQRNFSPITKHHFQAMILIMVLTLLYVTYETQFSSPKIDMSSPVLQKVNLVINDDPNGDILLTVIKTGPVTQETSTNSTLRFSGEQGFLRGTLRALARDRRMRNLTSEAPFELALHEDGRLSITDILTNKGIDLEAFGPDNVAVFAKILTEAAMQPTFNH